MAQKNFIAPNGRVFKSKEAYEKSLKGMFGKQKKSKGRGNKQQKLKAQNTTININQELQRKKTRRTNQQRQNVVRTTQQDKNLIIQRNEIKKIELQPKTKQIEKSTPKEPEFIRHIRKTDSTELGKKLTFGIRYENNLSPSGVDPLRYVIRKHFGEKALDRELGGAPKFEYIKKIPGVLIEEAKKPDGDVQFVIRGKPSYLGERFIRSYEFSVFRRRPPGESGIIYESDSKVPLL